MTEIIGDLLAVKTGLIAHQVNAYGTMGAGIAKSIAEKWPIVEEDYKQLCANNVPKELLGMVQIVDVGKGLFVANIFGQEKYGRGRRHTDYSAVEKAFRELANTWPGDVCVPFRMGCGLGGGDWKIYSQIIETILGKRLIVFRQDP